MAEILRTRVLGRKADLAWFQYGTPEYLVDKEGLRRYRETPLGKLPAVHEIIEETATHFSTRQVRSRQEKFTLANFALARVK